jgi:hypothetical protein
MRFYVPLREREREREPAGLFEEKPDSGVLRDNKETE